MKDLIEQIREWDGTAYPEMLRKLPEIDVPVEGIRGWLLQGPASQVGFFDIAQGTVLPSHSHAAQWGIMVHGEMELTIGGEKRTVRKGDSYYIPEGVAHSATFPMRVSVIDIFNQESRYSTKKK